MARQECVSRVVDYLERKKIKVGKQEMDDILSAIERKMRRYDDLSGPNDPRWDQAARDVITDVKIAAYVQRRNAKLNKMTAVSMDKLSAAADKAGVNVAEAMRAATVGTSRRFEGSFGNVDAMTRTLFASTWEAAQKELRNHPLGNLVDEFKGNGCLFSNYLSRLGYQRIIIFHKFHV